MYKESIDTDIRARGPGAFTTPPRTSTTSFTKASGLVIAPDGKGENRPLLTWCHGTTGLGDAACPSARPDPPVS